MKIKVSFSFIAFIFIGLLFNAFKYLFIFFFLALIHELCHIIFAVIFKVRVKELSFNVLGFSAELEDVEFKPFWIQIIIFLAGPLSFFPSLIILNILYKCNFFSIYSYRVALNDNLSLLIFNLLPFYPLDGGHIMEICLLKFFPSYKGKKICSLISLFVSIILLIECLKEYQYLLFVFIFYNALISLIFFKRTYHNYLLSRVGKVSSFPLKQSIFPNIFHFNYNYFTYKSNLISEDDYYIKEEIKTLTKKIKENK